MLSAPAVEAGSGAFLGAVDDAFQIMAGLLAALLLFFALLRRFLLRVAPDPVPTPVGMFEALRSRWAIFGAVAVGLYVGAEVSIGSIMINFLNQPNVLGVSLEEAGSYLANFYWGGALCGRIIGTVLLTRLRATRLDVVTLPSPGRTVSSSGSRDSGEPRWNR